jgi:hypothetical protein
VLPSLNRLYHSLICVMPMASSPKTCWTSKWFPLGYRQASGKIWCNAAARVVLSFSQKLTMWRVLHIHSCSYAGCTRLTPSAGGKKTTYVHDGPLHLPTIAHLPRFISFRGKKSRRILFEQATHLYHCKT